MPQLPEKKKHLFGQQVAKNVVTRYLASLPSLTPCQKFAGTEDELYKTGVGAVQAGPQSHGGEGGQTGVLLSGQEERG